MATHKDTLAAQIEVVKRHTAKIIGDINSEKKILKIVQKPQYVAKYVLRKQRYPEELALGAPMIAYEALMKLNLL